MPDFRVYFNRRREAPFVWSVDTGPGTAETLVTGFRLHRVTGCGRFVPDAGDNEATPTAWVEITYAVLDVTDGVANFFRDSEWRQPRLNNGQT